MRSLDKFEKWLLSKNLQPRNFISPLDRFASRIGYTGKPMIFLNFPRLGALLSFYWFIVFPLVYFLLMQLALRISIFEFFDEIVFLILVGTSLAFGFTTSYFMKRNFKKNSIPEWSEIAREN